MRNVALGEGQGEGLTSSHFRREDSKQALTPRETGQEFPLQPLHAFQLLPVTGQNHQRGVATIVFKYPALSDVLDSLAFQSCAAWECVEETSP